MIKNEAYGKQNEIISAIAIKIFIKLFSPFLVYFLETFDTHPCKHEFVNKNDR